MTEPLLEANEQEIERFYNAIFKYAAPDNYISLRTFRHSDDKLILPPGYRCPPCVKTGDPDLVSRICTIVDWAAQHDEGIGFAPPIASFTN